jgi:frataxin-like iron-binding protein CyaY
MPPPIVIASDSEAIHIWIASAFAQKRFGGLQARHSWRSERRRVVALLLAMTV